MKWAIVPLALLGACTPLRPQVSLEPGVSLKSYRRFVVEPVTDATGAAFNLSVTDSLRRQLADRLRSHGLTVAATPGDIAGPALVITSTLEGFKGIPFTLQLGGPGVTTCALRSVLRDGDTGRRLGEILAQDLEEGIRPISVLNECARDVGDAIHRLVR